MPISDSFGAPDSSEEEPQDNHLIFSGPDAVPEDNGAPHIHQFVSMQVGTTPDAVFVARTEVLVEHRHSVDPAPAPEYRPARGRARRPAVRRDSAEPAPGEVFSLGPKARMPNYLARAQIDSYLKQERRWALDARDPLAISFAAERYNTIMAFLDENPEHDPIDLARPILSVSQAAKILGYNAKEVRRLLGQGKISGRKVGSEWRIPLRAVL